MARQTKPPSKLNDCFIGAEIDSMIDDAGNKNDDHEDPKLHQQCDGKTNNVTFKTNRVEIWKQSLHSYFEHCSEHKDGATIKIQCKGDKPVEKIKVKFNFYKSGMVTIQGAKCKIFTSKYFEALKDIVNKNAQNPEFECEEVSLNDTEIVNKNLDIENTVYEETEVKVLDESTNDKTVLEVPIDYEETEVKVIDESTNDKTVIENPIEVSKSTNEINVSTPLPSSKGKAVRSALHHENTTPIPSPKAKVRLAEHQETLAVKLSCIGTALVNVDAALQTISNLVSEVRTVAAKFSLNFGGQLSKGNKGLKEQIESLESKVKHNNQTVESLHVKFNTTDNQIKKLTENQEEMMTKLNDISQQISNKTSNDDSIIDNVTTPIKHKEKQHYVKNAVNSVPEDLNLTSKSKSGPQPENRQTNSQMSTVPQKNNSNGQVSQCDNLILSDSILKRIRPSQFSSSETTQKRYIRGGAKTCTQFINNNGENFRPKRVLIHIGTRDIRNDGVNKNEFKLMFESVLKSWPSSDVYILPLLYRKDTENFVIDEANDRIISVAHDYPTLNILKGFILTDDMFYDYVHLNDSRGIPAIINFLKRQMNIPFTQSNTPQRMSNKPSIRHGELKNFNPRQYNERPAHNVDINNNNQRPPLLRNSFTNNNNQWPSPLGNPYNHNNQRPPPLGNPYNNNNQCPPPLRNPYSNNNQCQQPLGNQPGPHFDMPYFNPWLYGPRNMPPYMQRMDFQ